MRYYLSAGLKLSIVLIFLAGLISISLRTFGKQKVSARPSFVMMSRHYEVENGIEKDTKRTSTTFIDQENNRFKIIGQSVSSAKTKITYGDQSAFFDITNQKLEYISSCEAINHFNAAFISETSFRADPLYVRETEILGIKVFVFRNETARGWAEDYYSPLTGYFALKRVRFDKASGIETVEEAVSIQFRKINKEECEFPNLPFSFVQAESRAEALRNMGTPNSLQQADQIRADINRVKMSLGKKAT